MIESVPTDEKQGFTFVLGELPQALQKRVPLHHRRGQTLSPSCSELGEHLVGQAVSALLRTMMINEKTFGGHDQPTHWLFRDTAQVTPGSDVDLGKNRFGHPIRQTGVRRPGCTELGWAGTGEEIP